MSKHTPGPWRYCPENGSSTTGKHMIAGLKNGYLAEVRDCGSGDVKANARLISAAPDLLESLELLVDCYDNGGFDGAAVVIAKGAIAKATGK